MAKLSKMHERVIKASKKNPDPTVASLENKLGNIDDAKDLVQALDSIDGLVLPPNNHWDEAESFFQTTYSGIISANQTTAEHLSGLLADPVQHAKFANDAKLAVLVAALNSDVGTTIDRLNAVHAKHAGMSGSSTTTEQVAQAIDIFGQYSDIVEIYHTLIMPTVSEILSYTGGIEEIQAAAKEEQIKKGLEEQMRKLAEQQDPNVITDVVFKEDANG